MPSSYNRIHKNHAAFCTIYKSKSLLYTPSYQATTYEDNYELLNPVHSNRKSKVQRKIFSWYFSQNREMFGEKKPLSCKGLNSAEKLTFWENFIIEYTVYIMF